MKTLIVSEGEHELGKPTHAGALEILVKRLLDRDFDCECISVRHPGVARIHGKGDGMFKKAVACLKYAERNGYESIILVIDQDEDRSRRDQLNRAQEDMTFGVKRAIGIAIQTFDAWMLADEKALSDWLHSVVETQPNPEELTDAKDRCIAWRRQKEGEGWLPAMYAELANAIQLDVLERRCPDGFGVFAKRVRAL